MTLKISPEKIWRNTSLRANSPTSTGIRSSPSESRNTPNVKRCVDVNLSMPMMARNRPNAAEMMPFMGSLPDTAPTMESPIMAIQKYWLGPNFRAKRASGSVENTRMTTETNPPTTPAYSEMHSALPPSPLRCIS